METIVLFQCFHSDFFCHLTEEDIFCPLQNCNFSFGSGKHDTSATELNNQF
jgi:hypothetical protein